MNKCIALLLYIRSTCLLGASEYFTSTATPHVRGIALNIAHTTEMLWLNVINLLY